MNNLYQASDKVKTLQCNHDNNDNQFRNKIHYLKNLLKQIELSYEGFYCCDNYVGASISEHLQNEDHFHQEFYLNLFGDVLIALDGIFQEMLISNMRGE